VTLVARHAVPAIYEWRDFAALGGMASYGTNLTDGRQLRRTHPQGRKTGRLAGAAAYQV